MWGRGVGKTLFDACQKTKAAINHQEKRMRFATVVRSWPKEKVASQPTVITQSGN